MIDLLRGKEVLVVGMARSGMAAVELLSEIGAAKITVTDQKQAADLRLELDRLGHFPAVEAVTGENPPGLITASLAAVIKSPGVPPSLELFKRAEELSIPVLSEIELAYAFLKAPLVGVTGTNGKTTTTALVGAMLREASFDPVVTAGNIGNPLAGLVGKVSPQGLIVAELSSFQLENIDHFRPLVALFLNFAEDHLDYHGSMEKYFRAKARIFENQGPGDYAVLNAGDRAVASLEKECRGTVLWFDLAPVKRGFGLEDNWVTLYNPGSEPQKICPRPEISLPGDHNLENALAASAAAWAAGADPQAIGRALRTFKAIEHRLEEVAVLDGVTYVNDSKGTNPGATLKALSAYPGRGIVLIAGGKDKGADFSDLGAAIKKEVRCLVLFGETRDQISAAAAASGFTAIRIASDLADAVSIAAREARSPEVVLLSPACASWDMFTDYEARGNLFKELVRSLPRATAKGGGHNDG